MSDGFNDFDYKLSFNDSTYLSWKRYKINKEFDFTKKILYGIYENDLTLTGDDMRYIKNLSIPIRFIKE